MDSQHVQRWQAEKLLESLQPSVGLPASAQAPQIRWASCLAIHEHAAWPSPRNCRELPLF